VPVHLLYFAALAVMLLVLVGILTRQLQRAGRLGVAGFLQRFAMVLNHIAWLGSYSFMGNVCER
jgi:hypothetical protein